MRIRRIGLAAVAAVVVALSAIACVGQGSSPAGALQYPPRSSITPALDQEKSVQDVLADLGATCFRTAEFLRAAPNKERLAALAEAASRVPEGGGWLLPAAEPLAPGQAWIGTLERAAVAHKGDLVGPAEDRWIVTERDGRALAIQLSQVVVGDSSSAWFVSGRMAAVDCK